MGVLLLQGLTLQALPGPSSFPVTHPQNQACPSTVPEGAQWLTRAAESSMNWEKPPLPPTFKDKVGRGVTGPTLCGSARDLGSL